MFADKFSAAGMLIIGFVVMGFVSVILNFKHARVVDAMGDTAKIQAEIGELTIELRELQEEEKPDEKKIKKLQERVEELREEDLPKQRQDATNAMAALPNGAIFWSFLSQIGAGIFGLGLLAIFMREEEHPAVRSTALIVIGGLIFALLIARTAYLLMGGVSGAGAGF
ncbi:MAG: hypothetical protein R3242_11895 [Akkermansiaceae bacterium]|nr:hypothetical protein [Akkermansiaceae bacterium]